MEFLDLDRRHGLLCTENDRGETPLHLAAAFGQDMYRLGQEHDPATAVAVQVRACVSW